MPSEAKHPGNDRLGALSMAAKNCFLAASFDKFGTKLAMTLSNQTLYRWGEIPGVTVAPAAGTGNYRGGRNRVRRHKPGRAARMTGPRG